VPVLRDAQNVGVVKESKLLRLVFEDGSILDAPVATVMDAPLPEISLTETTDRVKEYLAQRDAAVLVRDGKELVGVTVTQQGRFPIGKAEKRAGKEGYPQPGILYP